MEKEKLNEILHKHERWLWNKEDGERANLEGADLKWAYLRWADLRGADLKDANLREAYLEGADLRWADLRGADLKDANLREAYLEGADLRGADLKDANLREANLRDVTLDNGTKGLNNRMLNRYFPMSCPEYGEFIGWKKALDSFSRPLIVKLKITENAKRSSAFGRKCRCSEAVVLAIENIDGTPSDETEAFSYFDTRFVYRVGETVRVPNFDNYRAKECASGIHFFITRQEAVDYGA